MNDLNRTATTHKYRCDECVLIITVHYSVSLFLAHLFLRFATNHEIHGLYEDSL